MERPDLIGTGRKAGNPEVPEGSVDQVFLDALDDHFSARQNAPVQTVDYNSGDFHLARFLSRDVVVGAGCWQRAAHKER